ncbi:MAG TPA: bifunctional oligoribonuclease/PAP phosphatase NrnA [Anaerolineaceae bacterium]|nr:bifunctional oligoribonuclease/PAP phosphatase NrnA [Anaerolineaceae bacterium]
MENKEVALAVGQKLREAHQILVVSHVRPDGDAIGSILGLGLALREAGKNVQMVLSDGVPSSIRYLVGSDQIKKRAEGEFDLIIVLDSSDLARIGDALSGLRAPDVNIDHHVTNLEYAALNLVDADAVSTTTILARHLEQWEFPISPDVASALLTGLISDTLGFRTSNMNPEALRIAANLMERGADLPELYSLSLMRRSYPAAQYWGAGLSRLQRRGRLIWTSLTLADRETVAYPGNDDADLVNLLSAITDVDVAIIFVEQRGNKVKVSWRAIPGFDVSQLALKFGGGGHIAAAGAEVQGTLVEVQEQVLDATVKYLENGNHPRS